MKPGMPLTFSLSIWLLLGWHGTLTAQSPITAFSASYQSASSSISLYSALSVSLGAFGGCSGTQFTYTFSNSTSNQYKLNNFNAIGSAYVVAPVGASVVRLRRVNNAQATGTRNIVYMESTAATAAACPLSATLNFKPPYMDVMEDLLAAGMLNQGTDNVFTNASNGDGNNNNIERVDVIFPGGLNTLLPAQAGFAIFDRGNNYQHDAFKIAAITSLDAAGNPAGFGPVKACTAGNGSNNNGSWGHPSAANGNKQLAYYVMRKDILDLRLRASSNGNQEIGGVFYSFADLGIAPGQALYGYALLGPDGIANPTPAQLMNLNDATVYPTQTTEAGGGGLDLVAVNTVFATGGYVTLNLPDPPAPGPQPDPAPPVKGWQLFPTMPVRGQSLQLKGLKDGSYMLSLYNTSGVCRTTLITISGGRGAVPSPTVPGIYWAQLSTEGKPIPGKANVLIE